MSTSMKVAAMGVLALAVFAAGPARAQGGDLKEVLAGRSLPLTLKLKEVRSDWRRISLGGIPEAPGSGGIGQLAGGIFGALFGGGAPAAAPAPPAYYTQGQTLTLGTETYLVAYKAQLKGLDLTALMQAGPEGKLPPPERLTPDSELALSLLNLRSVASITNIRPFNMERELEESAKAAEAEARLREQLGKGMGAGAGAFPGPPGGELPPQVEPEPAPKAAPAPRPAPKAAPKKPAPKRRP